MLARHRAEVPVPFEQVALSMRSGPQGWIPDLVEAPDGRVLCSIAVSPWLVRQAKVGVGPPRSGDGWLSVPVSWCAAEADVLFPVFVGEVRAKRLPEARTELCLVGSYQPPLGPVGELVDHAVLHWVAGKALAGFLARAAEMVAEGTKGPVRTGT